MKLPLPNRKPFFLYFLFMVLCSGCFSNPSIKKAKAFTVEIKQMKFVPAELVLQIGDTVRFINHDLVPHDITEISRKAWTSTPIPVDSSWSLVIAKTANYYCSIHPVMKGKLFIE